VGICGAVRLIRLPTERQVMTTIYSQYGSTDITNFAPQHNHIPQHTFSRSVPDTTGAQPPRLTVIHHNANVRLVLHGKYLELKIQPKISSDPFPHSPRESSVIHHPLINLPFLPSPFARGPVIAPLWISGNHDGELRPDISASFTKQNM
jgi:hypothetical protein